MFERFTKAAREVVERTQQIALESRASQVRPEHLFAALVWDDRCLAVRVLNDQGGTSERLHAELDRRRVALRRRARTTPTPRRWRASGSTSRRWSAG